MLQEKRQFLSSYVVILSLLEIKSLSGFMPPDVFTQTIRMPDAVSDKPDSLLCHGVKLQPEEAYIRIINDPFPPPPGNFAAIVYLKEQSFLHRIRDVFALLKYEPHASKKVAHHMMVYGCGRPGSDKPYWSCSSMDDHSNKSVCGDGERQIVWAWAMDADGRKFPKDVGFRVGGSTGINYIVIQLHYAKKFLPGGMDKSGVTLHMTHTPQPLQAGYYVLYTYGYIPPMVEEYHIESACTYINDYKIFPIAYRTHSHNLGVVTSGYRVRNGTWTEIGRMSPQLPQTFYDVTHPGIDIQTNDILAARCTMSSQRSEFTVIGSRNQDEMCNFYILYYTAARQNLKIQYCMRDGAKFRWSDYLTEPPETASSTSGLPSFTRADPYATRTIAQRDQAGVM